NHSENPAAALFDIRYADKTPRHQAHLVGPGEIREIVFEKIRSFLQEYQVRTPIVAGVSGGGDSSSIVQGVRRHVEAAGLPVGEVLCYTIVFPPIWGGAAAGRARDLCDESGFEHRVLYPEDIS